MCSDHIRKLYKQHYKSPLVLAAEREVQKKQEIEQECQWMTKIWIAELTNAFGSGYLETTWTEPRHISDYASDIIQCATSRLEQMDGVSVKVDEMSNSFHRVHLKYKPD